MKFSLCIPMYNEHSIIADTAKAVSEYMEKNFDDYEVLFADDGSTDNSAQLVEDLHLPNVRVVGYKKNRGKGYAVKTAMLAAQGDLVMFTDADLAYGLDIIRTFYETALSDPKSSVFIGSRNLHKDGYENYTLIRKVASKTYIKVLCLAGGFKLSDSQCGCKAFRKDAVQKIFPRCEVERFAFDFEAILWANKFGLKIKEIPVKVINHRESKVRVLHDTFEMLQALRKMQKRISRASIDE